MNTAEFRRTVNSAAAGQSRENPAAIVRELQTAAAELRAKCEAIGVSEDEIGNMTQKLVAAAEARWMRTRYAELDMSFAAEDKTREMWISRGPDGKLIGHTARENRAERVAVKVPIFVQASDSLGDWYATVAGRQEAPEEGTGIVGQIKGAGKSRSMDPIYASVRCPDGLTKAMLDRARRCIGYAAMFDAILLREGFLQPANRRRGLDGGYPDRSVCVLWAPIPEAWSFSHNPPRPKGDPAVLVESRGNTYLVGFYDTPDEKPIDNLIREFTRGPVPRKRK